MASSFVDEQSWEPQDWKWDSYNLKASPNDAPATKSGGGKAARSAAADGTKQGCQVCATCPLNITVCINSWTRHSLRALTGLGEATQWAHVALARPRRTPWLG